MKIIKKILLTAAGVLQFVVGVIAALLIAAVTGTLTLALYVFAYGVIAIIPCLLLWLAASGAVSYYKFDHNLCSQILPIEHYVNGKLLCPEGSK